MIAYPVGVSSDSDRLKVLYRLCEEARLAHNVEGAKARADWDINRWAAYVREFDKDYRVLQGELARLRQEIRRANFSDADLKDLDPDEWSKRVELLYGDVEAHKQAITLATSDDLVRIKALSYPSKAPKIIDPVEDFSTYTETDPNGRISKTASRITWTNLTQNEDAWVYDDKGVDHFSGDFEHLITVSGDYVSGGSSPYSGTWCLYNTITDCVDLYLNDDCLLCLIRYINDSSGYQILNVEAYTTGRQTSGYMGVQGTTYYLKIVRDEAVGTYGTSYVYIYDDAARTNLLSTQTLTLNEKEDFRYVSGCISWNSGNSGVFDGWSENLDLQEAVVGALPMAMDHYRRLRS